MNWQKAIPNTIIVNGDKPFIDVRKKLVYGTPWCGKERFNNNISAPLTAIIELQRGSSNTIRQICFKEILHTIIRETFIPSERKLALKVYESIQMLSNTPCYQLTCNMEEESALVAYQALSEVYYDTSK